MKPQRLDFNYFKHIINCCIAALFAGAAILLSGCQNNDLDQIKAFISPENLPVVEAKDFQTLFTDSGQVRFFLKTPLLLRFENEGNAFVEFPEGMELIKYDENEKVISSITANYAKQFVKEKKWEAKNNVVATNAQGDTLKTEHLIWEEEEGKIYTNEYVKIIRPDQIYTGVGFESDQTLDNWKIKNPKGTIYVSSESTDNTSRDTVNVEPENEDLKIQPFQEPINFKK